MTSVLVETYTDSQQVVELSTSATTVEETSVVVEVTDSPSPSPIVEITTGGVTVQQVLTDPVVEAFLSSTVVEAWTTEGATVEVLVGSAVQVEPVEVTPEVVEIVLQGPPGEKGEPGETVYDPTKYGKTMNFAIPAKLWIFDHNLGFVPSVMLYDSQGKEIRGRVVKNTTTTTHVEFYFSVPGSMSVS